MDSAKISTELDNLAYTPGESLRGTVAWRCAARPATVALRLFYYTSGKGTQDVCVVEERVFDAPSETDQRTYEFQLPDGPWSFSGKLVSLIWALELEVDLGPDHLVERLDFTLSPTGEEILLHAHAHAEMPAYSDIAIGSWKQRKRPV
jgi:hypothetical protein